MPSFPSDLLPSPRVAAPTTAVISLKQLKTEGATSPCTNLLPESSARQQTVMLAREESAYGDFEEETGGVRQTVPAVEKTSSTFVPKRGQNASASASDEDDSESDASVEMMEPSDVVVIDIASDNEDAPNVPVHQEPPPQKSVSVEFNSSNTQKNDAER